MFPTIHQQLLTTQQKNQPCTIESSEEKSTKHTKDTPVQAKIDQKRFLLGHLLQQPAKKAKLGRLKHGGKNKIKEVALNKSLMNAAFGSVCVIGCKSVIVSVDF